MNEYQKTIVVTAPKPFSNRAKNMIYYYIEEAADKIIDELPGVTVTISQIDERKRNGR